MAPITINGNTIDPAAPAITPSGADAAKTAASHHILLQAPGPLSPAQKDQLRDEGVVLDEYISANTYLCHYGQSGKGLDKIRNLNFVAQPYPDDVVISAGLKESSHFSTAGLMAVLRSRPKEVDIILHEYLPKDEAQVKDDIARAAHLDGTNLQGGSRKVRAIVDEQYFSTLAHMPEVRAILPVIQPVLFNNVARQILNADVPITGGGIFSGVGETVAVADTGVDENHPALRPRVVHTQALGRPSLTNDPQGHGTHVSGSIVGNLFVAGEGNVRGTAYGAELGVQSLLDRNGGLGGIPADLHDLFIGPYTKWKARVHNNSWGLPATGLSYDRVAGASEIDKFVYEHKDMIICLAAGNEGEDLNTDGVVDLSLLGAHAAAKNNITVGASESFRPALNLTFGQLPRWDDNSQLAFVTQPLQRDRVADNPDGMVAFSSRGPTQESRIKPDVVAPGSAILSAKSRITVDNGDWGISPDVNLKYDSGTSMACPLVAGCAATIRQALRQHPPEEPRSLFPTAALVKALIINGAVELKGQYALSEAGSSPNPSSGWGRVDLSKSIILNGGSNDTAGYVDANPINETGPPFKKEIQISSAGQTLKVTLVWTDPPGKELQNDLDLIVNIVNSDGKKLGNEHHGNKGTDSEFDRVNNVEQVRWENIPQGIAVLEVRPFHFATTSTQDFALVWTVSATE